MPPSIWRSCLSSAFRFPSSDVSGFCTSTPSDRIPHHSRLLGMSRNLPSHDARSGISSNHPMTFAWPCSVTYRRNSSDQLTQSIRVFPSHKGQIPAQHDLKSVRTALMNDGRTTSSITTPIHTRVRGSVSWLPNGNLFRATRMEVISDSHPKATADATDHEHRGH